MKNILFCFIWFATVLKCNSQTPFNLTINFSENIDTKNIVVGFNDGSESRGLPLTFSGQQATASDKHFSKYATVWIVNESEPESFKWKEFWVSGDATINCTKNETGMLQCTAIENATDLDQLAKTEGLESAEYLAFHDFATTYLSESYTGDFTDSLHAVRIDLTKKWRQQDLAYVQANPANYFAFDYLRRNLLYAYLEPDTLLSSFSLFPAEFRESFEGKLLQTYLVGKSLKNGSKIPKFEGVDFYKRTAISSEEIKKKNTLLVFWASWCRPCIRELPKVKEFIEAFPENKLTTIFITMDDDINKFKLAVEKHNLQFYQHVFGDKEIFRTFGINGVPEIYFIDNKGIVKYRRSENNDNELDGLTELKK